MFFLFYPHFTYDDYSVLELISKCDTYIYISYVSTIIIISLRSLATYNRLPPIYFLPTHFDVLIKFTFVYTSNLTPIGARRLIVNTVYVVHSLYHNRT